MKKVLLLSVLSFVVIACERHDMPNNSSSRNSSSSYNYDADNTGRNIRDRHADMKSNTPFDQSENKTDRAVTQKIRQAIMDDAGLSTNAKNIKIITQNGVVTLRGPVANAQEKDAILRKVNDIQGVSKVDNQLEITRSNY